MNYWHLRHTAIEEAKAAGRLGSAHIPPGALTAVVDPTDTFIGALVDAHAIGLRERESTIATPAASVTSESSVSVPDEDSGPRELLEVASC